MFCVTFPLSHVLTPLSKCPIAAFFSRSFQLPQRITCHRRATKSVELCLRNVYKLFPGLPCHRPGLAQGFLDWPLFVCVSELSACGCLNQSVTTGLPDLCRAYFNKGLLDSDDGFMDIACAQAREEANGAMAIQPTPQRKMSKAVRKVPARKIAQSKPARSQAHGHWWSKLGSEAKDTALKQACKSDLERGSKMTAKCFSSRLYGRLKATGVQLAREARRNGDEDIRALKS